MAIFKLLMIAATAFAQTKYGENHVTVNFDAQIVEQTAFPTPNVTLYSPAFLPNASFTPGWSKGTKGATSLKELGWLLDPLMERNNQLTHLQTPSSVASQRRTLLGLPMIMLSF